MRYTKLGDVQCRFTADHARFSIISSASAHTSQRTQCGKNINANHDGVYIVREESCCRDIFLY